MLSLWVAGFLAAQSASQDLPSRDFPATVPKSLGFEYARLSDPENNARIWWSCNQAFGWASLRLGAAGADRYWSARAGQFLGLAYLNLAVGHYTHELGHEIHRKGWSISLADWGSPWPWPRFNHGRYPAGTRLGIEERIAVTEAGLNLEEYDAYLAFKESTGSMSFDESMAFSFRKLSAVTYDTYTGRSFGYHQPGMTGDVEGYTSLLREKGIPFTGKTVLLQAAVSDLLTFRLYEAWIGSWEYLRHGKRERANFAWRTGRWTLLPPLVNWYLTPRGGFYDLALFSDPPGPGYLETRLGWDSDFLGGGDVDRIRLGGAYSLTHRLGKPFEARCAPSAFATLRRSDAHPVGWIAGLETGLLIFERAEIATRLEYGRGDLVEHIAKSKAEGLLFALRTGLRI